MRVQGYEGDEARSSFVNETQGYEGYIESLVRL